MTTPVGDSVVDFARIQDAARAVLEEACTKHLDGAVYDVKYQTRWSDAVTQTALDSLVRFGQSRVTSGQRRLTPNFKFMVSCLLVQKRRTCVEVAATAFWDASTDGSCCVQWCVPMSHASRPSRESPSIICVLNAFATAI